jgi:signal transduction histidine kinase
MVVPQEISRAVLNLMNNACYTVWRKSATAPADYQPAIDISVATQGTELVISIADNGEGMSPEVQRRLYENFYTTKPIGEGTGLGMSITRDIVEHIHGGRLSFQTKEGEGTCFTMTIPLTNR